MYVIAKHIIAQMEDTTPLALQKILYYIEGFSLALLDKNILLTIHKKSCSEIEQLFFEDRINYSPSMVTP